MEKANRSRTGRGEKIIWETNKQVHRRGRRLFIWGKQINPPPEGKISFWGKKKKIPRRRPRDGGGGGQGRRHGTSSIRPPPPAVSFKARPGTPGSLVFWCTLTEQQKSVNPSSHDMGQPSGSLNGPHPPLPTTRSAVVGRRGKSLAGGGSSHKKTTAKHGHMQY